MMLPSRRRMLSNLGSGVGMVGLAGVMDDARSEEHTSELQSH